MRVDMREEMPSHLSPYTPHLDPEYLEKVDFTQIVFYCYSCLKVVKKFDWSLFFLDFQEASPLAKEPQDEPEIDSNPTLEPEADLESPPASETVSPEQESMETVTVSLTKKKGKTCKS